MREYKELVRQVLNEGRLIEGRNGNTINTFGKQLELPPAYNGFPIVTGRKIHYKGVLGELAAFLQSPTHITDFREHGCNYWDDWADTNGDIRVDYGNKWQDFNGVNQLKRIVKELKDYPHSRRHVMIGWDPSNLDKLSLPCCHYGYQWMVNAEGSLDMLWIQRSADVMIGIPSDMVAAVVLNALMAQTVGLLPGRVVMQLGSTHIYEQHIFNAYKYLDRPIHALPGWALDTDATVFNFTPEMFSLTN
jgi:thymidylate synthase